MFLGRLLTIVGGGREASSVWGRGTQSILRARGRWLAWSCGPSTSPLDGQKHTRRAMALHDYLFARLYGYMLGRSRRNTPEEACRDAIAPFMIITGVPVTLAL